MGQTDGLKEWREIFNSMNKEDRKNERRKILKNVILIAFGFFLNFIAFTGLTHLQSSLHLDEGLGVVAQAVLYGTMVVSCVFTPKVVIRLCGHKWTIPFMFIGNVTWLVANGHGVWWTMVPASVIVGIVSGPLWTAQASYYSLEAQRYVDLTKQEEGTVLTKFFGIFFCFFQASDVVGAIISSVILQPTTVNGTRVLPSEEDLQFCGANNCPGSNITNPNLEKQDPIVVWILVGSYVFIAIVGIIMLMVFLDDLPPYMRTNRNNAKISEEIKALLLATMKQTVRLQQLLILPMTIYNGYEQGFFFAEFNQAYTSCSIGIWNVGLIVIAFGSVNAAVSVLIGYIVKYTGRKFLITTAFVIHLSEQIFLLIWMPHPDEAYLLYIAAGLWGASDAIWQSVISAIYGSLFKEQSEAAFGNFRLWQSVGFFIAFCSSSLLCTSAKLYMLMIVMIVGMIGYIVLEVLLYRATQGKQEKNGIVHVATVVVGDNN